MSTYRRRKASAKTTRRGKKSKGLMGIDDAQGNIGSAIGQTALNLGAGIAGGIAGAMLGRNSLIVGLPAMTAGLFYGIAPLAFAGTGVAIGGWAKPTMEQEAEVEAKKAETGGELNVGVQTLKAKNAFAIAMDNLKQQTYLDKMTTKTVSETNTQQQAVSEETTEAVEGLGLIGHRRSDDGLIDSLSGFQVVDMLT